MNLLSSLVLLLVLGLAQEPAFADELSEQPSDTETSYIQKVKPYIGAVEYHVGAGSPYGTYGLALFLAPSPYIELGLGGGYGFTGPHWASAQLRLLTPGTLRLDDNRWRIGLGGGASAASYDDGRDGDAVKSPLVVWTNAEVLFVIIKNSFERVRGSLHVGVFQAVASRAYTFEGNGEQKLGRPTDRSPHLYFDVSFGILF